MAETMKYISTTLVVLLAQSLYAQNWAPDGATWRYGFFVYPSLTGYVIFEATGDTMINGRSTRKIDRHREEYNTETQQSFTSDLPMIFSHATDNVVWIYVEETNEFDTLYNLNAMPGDHWAMVPLPDPFVCIAESRVIILDTGTVVMNDIPLRWLAVENHYNLDPDELVVPDTIVERIGSSGVYMLPQDPCNGFGGQAEGGGLLCYADAEIDYISPFIQACDIGLGIPVNSNSAGVRLFPNPGSDELQISFSATGPANTVLVHDIHGRLVAQQAVQRSSFTLDTSLWNSGQYILSVVGGAGQYFSTRWSKQ